MVLEKKGLDRRVISRIQNLYRDNLTIVVVNNIQGKSFKNITLSLRQGDPLVYYQLNIMLVGKLASHFVSLCGGLSKLEGQKFLLLIAPCQKFLDLIEINPS